MGNREKVALVRRKAMQQANDRLRQKHDGGRVVLTQGIRALPVAIVAKILIGIREYEFARDGEHDYGRVLVDDYEAFFRIDCLNADLDGDSSDPSEPALTSRVLTIFTASEV